MARKLELTQELVKSILDYDEDSGVFTWKVRVARRVRIGDIAGSINAAGYPQLKIFNSSYLAHRVAWLYAYGVLPDGFVDHINKNPLDCRLCNLRLATNQENKRNGKLYSNNKSGFRGVYRKGKGYEAWLKINGVNKYLGYFKSAEKASEKVEATAKAEHLTFYREVNNG